ncbi:MAG: hypothetical protein IPL79_02570 [Myxococcales bacterium]|nr:hypothetical protein [Myxococcales bacterium]
MNRQIMSPTNHRVGRPRWAHWVIGATAVIALGCKSSNQPGPVGPGVDPSTGDPSVMPVQNEVTLQVSGLGGTQRVNLGLPLALGQLREAGDITVRIGGQEVAAGTRSLALYGDGSHRSVQLQFDINPATHSTAELEIGRAPTTARLDLVAAADLTDPAGEAEQPSAWVVLPASYLAASGVAGPLLSAGAAIEKNQDAWLGLCDYGAFGFDEFIDGAGDKGSWLFDRPTALYRGYVQTGDQPTLASAYKEASMYRAGLAVSGGVATGIAVPGASDDLKYYYAQGMALHYLLTGDDRYREAAEAVAARAHQLWDDPGYAGGDDFWTERHAGFALLAFEWAAMVSDDRAVEFAGYADAAAQAYIDIQNGADTCFVHSATAHGEDYGYDGCSPWMSAIIADGLDTYARRMVLVDAARAESARESLVRLGRAIAAHGLDSTGRPFYWMAMDRAGEVDDYNEHWGESAYVVALAWHWSGRTDAALRSVADNLVTGLSTFGEVGQLRSFNWQCRSAVMAPAFLAY